VIRRGMSCAVREPGFSAIFRCPDGDGPFTGVLALGGSDGGIPEYWLDLLVPAGFACLAIEYFGSDDTQPTLVEVPVERIERGLRWLASQPSISTVEGRVAVTGVSKGGELALLVASLFPHLVGPVVAYTPSSVVWAGIDFGEPRGSRQSSWTRGGVPVPHVPYPENTAPTVSERGFAGLPIYERGLENLGAVEDAAIAVELAAGPILVISGGDDHLWPAERMCRMLVDRMCRHGRSDVTHLNYPEAGHALFPLVNQSRRSVAPPFELDFGGSPDVNAAAHRHAWERVLEHLHRKV
jgi:uncharacterized protein